jgi:hypothetical protein
MAGNSLVQGISLPEADRGRGAVGFSVVVEEVVYRLAQNSRASKQGFASGKQRAS